MPTTVATPARKNGPSRRETELLEAAYRYAVEQGLADLSLRPLAQAIGSSPRVLLYLFDSKDGLIRALLTRARTDELAMIDRLSNQTTSPDLATTGRRRRSSRPRAPRPRVLALWVEAYARSLVDPHGPWAEFAERTVADWLDLLSDAQPSRNRGTQAAVVTRTAVLAVLRGAMLDLLATGDLERTTRAVERQLATLTA